MLLNQLPKIAVAVALTMLCLPVGAQQGGGMCRGGGGGGAGGRGPGGGGRGAGGGNGMSAFNMMNQMAQAQQMQTAANNAAARAAAENRLQATTSRFVQTAMTFDQDADQLLDQEELSQVAAAVIAELETRQRRTQNRRRQNSQPRQGTESNSPSAANPMQERFVARALSFDRNNDGKLNAAETSQMARALIQSLS